MANSLFNTFGNQNQYTGMIQQFQQFKRTFQGNPQQMVMDLLNSGRMSPQQFNQLQSMAQQMRGILGK